jgi:hypothetical protein
VEATSQAAASTAAPSDTPQPSATVLPSPTPSPEPIPANPVSLGVGLASLDTYLLKITTRVQSNDPSEFVETSMEVQQSHPQDAQVLSSISVTGSPETSSPERSESTSYQIGLETCSISDGEVEFNTLDPIEKEMASIFNRLMDVLPVIENPEYIGDETVNGIATHHFSFSLSGLGSQSGAVVTTNQGEYWLAVEGQYLVKYQFVIELSSTPEENIRQEYRLELQNVNQPLTISFPPECLAARGTQ